LKDRYKDLFLEQSAKGTKANTSLNEILNIAYPAHAHDPTPPQLLPQSSGNHLKSQIWNDNQGTYPEGLKNLLPE
jgi:hypothetical protein